MGALCAAVRRELAAAGAAGLGRLLELLKWAPDLKKGRGGSKHKTLAKLVLAAGLAFLQGQGLGGERTPAEEEAAWALVVANPTLLPDGLEALFHFRAKAADLMPRVVAVAQEGEPRLPHRPSSNQLWIQEGTRTLSPSPQSSS